MPFGFTGAQAQPDTAPATAQPYQPSWWDVAQGMLFDGQSPAESAMAARQRNYQIQQNALLMDTLQHATPEQRQAMIFNGPEYGKALSGNFAPVQTAAGATQTMFGGQTQPGGYSTMAPQFVKDDTSGSIGVQSQGGFTPQGQFGGGYTANNGVIASSRTGQVAGTYSTPQVIAPGSAPGSFTPTLSGMAAAATQAGQPGQPGQPAPQGQTAGPLDGRTFFRSFVLPHEGGLNPADMNGAPTKYGINQKANPGVNVANLTPDQAEQVFLQKYWGPSGAANMPAPLAAVHADTYFINPKMAGKFLQQSGGDPTAYLGLREQWMQNLVQSNPKALPYAKAWSNRNAALEQIVGQGAGQPQGQAPAGWSVGAPVSGMQHLSPQEAKARGYAPGSIVQVDPTGKETADTANAWTPERYITVKGQLADKDPIKNYQSAMDAYGAMVRAAAQPQGGMRAYALRDTFARLINPGAVARPQVIEALKHAQGLPANVQSYLLNLKGDGDVPPQIAQQIMDVAHGFLASHFHDAKALNDNYGQMVSSLGGDGSKVVMPGLDQQPGAAHLGMLPPKEHLTPGDIYVTRQGPAVWTGTGFKRYGGN